MTLPTLVVLATLSTVMSAVCGVLVADRWHKPGANWFVICMFGAAVWSGGYAVALLVFDPSIRWLLEVPIWIGHGVAPVGFFVFILRYTGRLGTLTPSRHALLWLIPVLTLAMVLTNGRHGLMWTGYEIVSTGGAATALYTKGPWLFVHKGFSYVVLAVAGIVLLQTIVERESLYTVQAAELVAVLVPLSIGSVAWVFAVGPYPQVSTTPLLFGPAATVFALALFRSSMFDSAPAARRIGKRRVTDDFDDGVVLLDETNRIVDANDAAVDILDADRSPVGHPIEAVLGTPTPAIDPGRKTVRLETVAGHREYEIAISTIANDSGTVFGHSLVFRDVTEARQRQQRLAVLNRVLRHNLRNDLNIIGMYAAELEETLAEPESTIATTIADRSSKLGALGEQARRIERALEATTDQPQRFSVAEMITAICEEYDHRATITTTLTGNLEVVTYPATLEIVLVDTIENAVSHGNGEVMVTVEGSESVLSITVTDNGPGIPEQELTPIEAGTETALDHASGLGLWAISWGTAALGGSVGFDRPEEGGTTVLIQLPRELEG